MINPEKAEFADILDGKHSLKAVLLTFPLFNKLKQFAPGTFCCIKSMAYFLLNGFVLQIVTAGNVAGNSFIFDIETVTS